MAGIALDPSFRAAKRVVNFASEISTSRNAEIELMTRWLTTLGQTSTGDSTAAEQHHDELDGWHGKRRD